jgi:hypothetical protein
MLGVIARPSFKAFRQGQLCWRAFMRERHWRWVFENLETIGGALGNADSKSRLWL